MRVGKGMIVLVFMEDFLGEPPRVNTISLIESKRSLYWTMIVCEGGRISKKFCMPSLVVINFLCLTQQSIWSPSTLAFEKKFFYYLRVYNPNRIQELCPHPFLEHFRYENVLKGFQLNNPFHDNGGFVVVVIVLQICLNGFPCFVDFLVVECLVGDICIREHRTEKKHVHKHKTKHKNLIRFKLVQTKVKPTLKKQSITELKQNKTSLKQHAITDRTCKQHYNARTKWLCMCVHVLCKCVQHVMHWLCLVCAWHGIEAQKS